jgi:predicted TIM-barrel fold metal-dependent hydrolase
LNRRDLVLKAMALSLVGERALAGSATPHRIDVHFHVLPPQYLAEAPAAGNVQRPFGRTPEASLADMDRNGVAVAMLSFPTPFYWFSGAEAGRRLARLCNDYYAGLVQQRPKRFGLFAALPLLDDTDAVLREIAYAYDTLGADGVAVMSNYGGRYLGDETFAPIWQELDRRKAVVFVHPADAPCCTAVNDGVGVGYGEFPFDTARTVMSLWARNALAERPNIRFIFSHGGGALPMIADRIDKFGRPGAKGEPPVHDALTFIRKLYFDTANAAGPSALPAVRGMVDPGHILFGSDFPYIPFSRSVENLARAGLRREELSAIERGNALALLPRLRAAGA